jgi:uncharacterized protein
LDHIIAARVTGFVGTLRANGFPIGIGEVEDALRVAEATGLLAAEPLRWGWRALLCGREDEWNRFDTLFDSFWLPPNAKALVEARAGGVGGMLFDPGEIPAGGKAGPALQRADDLAAEGGPGDMAREGASRAACLEQADFRTLTSRDQVYDIEAAIRRFARRLRLLATRREQAERRGRRLDLRRILRRSIGAGGVPRHLLYRAKRRVRPRLVLLLDVSRSMSLYSFFHLRAARALAAELTDIQVFLYHTHLTQVSEALADPDPWRAQERLALLSAGWAGGTRIGECLAEFNRRFAPRLVHSRTAVILASDGYDTGAAGLLGAEMAALAGRAHRVAWLNPLKAAPGYAPLARGMQEALPYLDLFAAGHDLASLEQALSNLLEVL